MTAPESLLERLRAKIADERVVAAVASVPRELFVPAAQSARAWDDVALPIDCGQTISQPSLVARMLQLLSVEPGHRVLDVGTGSGYHAALLARLGARVWSIERHPALSSAAGRALERAGVRTEVTLLVGDGTRGWRAFAPFDAINVAAAATEVPGALEDQLAPGGRMIVPVGHRRQRLVLVVRSPAGSELRRVQLDPVRFVPLVAD